MTSPVRVAVGVIRQNGKYLLCQRRRGGRYALKWEFPGGKVEPGETIEQCLHRELQEELGVVPGKVDKILTRTWFYDDGGDFEVAFCFVKDFSGEIRNLVFEDIGWFTLDELRVLDVLEGNKPIIEGLAVPQ